MTQTLRPHSDSLEFRHSKSVKVKETRKSSSGKPQKAYRPQRDLSGGPLILSREDLHLSCLGGSPYPVWGLPLAILSEGGTPIMPGGPLSWLG